MTVRSRRTAATPAVVAVTGAAGGLGGALVERLARRSDVRLIGVDSARGRAADVDWRPAGVRDPLLADRLSGAATVVHLDVTWDVAVPTAERRAHTVRGTALLVDAALAAGVQRLVLVTSADVYGAQPAPLLDAAPLLGAPDDAALVGDHVEVERLADHAVRSGLAVTVLRPAALVGGTLGPSYDGQLLRQLGGPRLLAVRGVEPLWQLCHADDLLAALELAATGAVTGGLAVACQGALPQSQVEALAGRRRLELPAAMALATAERLRRVGLTTSSPRELDHLLAPLVVACDGLRSAGWSPHWTNEAALRAHLAERPADGTAAVAAASAAGATVALLGTAALVRRARHRRGRS